MKAKSKNYRMFDIVGVTMRPANITLNIGDEKVAFFAYIGVTKYREIYAVLNKNEKKDIFKLNLFCIKHGLSYTTNESSYENFYLIEQNYIDEIVFVCDELKYRTTIIENENDK